MGRPSKNSSRMRKNRLKESHEEIAVRLSKNAKRNAKKRSQETAANRQARLSQMKNYIATRLSAETPEERKRRLNLIHARLITESKQEREQRLKQIRFRLSHESVDEREHRLSLIRTRLENESTEQRQHRLRVIRDRLDNESLEQRQHRLQVIRDHLENESLEQRQHRLGVIRDRLENESLEQRQHRISLIHDRLENESLEERQRRLSLIRDRIQNESLEQRQYRLDLCRLNVNRHLTKESREERLDRLTIMRDRNSQSRRNENYQQREERLTVMRQRSHSLRCLNEEQFSITINQFADKPCMVCKKLLYPKQRVNIKTSQLTNLVPNSLKEKENLLVCSRCSGNLRRHKVPSQAYWNKMEVTPIPPELASLSDIEQRLLNRIIPFLKIIKVHNRFSQRWCKGQVVLFAQDVVEVAEQLPLSLSNAGLVIIAESRENLPQTRQFSLNIQKIKVALQWLINNNDLYRDVRQNFADLILNHDISQLVEINDIREEVDDIAKHTQNIIPVVNNQLNRFVTISENVSILRGSFHQGSDKFSIVSRGRQCTGIAAVACAAFYVSNPYTWSVSDIDYIIIVGDKYYKECILARRNPDVGENNIEYLAATELLPRLLFNRRWININVQHDMCINGHIDLDQTADGFPNLKNGLTNFYRDYSYGILTANSISISIAAKDDYQNVRHFLLLDSHARGPKGYKAESSGVSCCMKFSNIDELHRVIYRNLRITKGQENMLNVYSITPISINLDENATPIPVYQTPIEEDVSNNVLQLQQLDNNQDNQEKESNQEKHLIFSTSILSAIDENIPNLNEVVVANNENMDEARVLDLKRKTAPPLYIERERRMEELCWYFLYPNGKNGFGEQRDLPITPLDYFQARIMSDDSRFQRNDYLFFALSIVEYFKAKSSVSVSCRMRQGENTPQGLVDNMHLTIRNIRGSAAYWKRCCSELIAMVRSLGPPTWFVTFSCNDLNWPDMIKALLIADGQADVNKTDVPYEERLELVEKYPIVISRQFTLRVNALMKFLKDNVQCVGGPIVDYWYRIEFQNRGSPHLHMLLWCDNIPDFNTPEGVRVIDEVVSCSLDGECGDLAKRLQIHKHSATCYKSRTSNNCRFGFPRATNDFTCLIDPDEAMQNNGRVCILKRGIEEIMVNNYNPTLLKIWQANMDVQPCGNIEAISYYIAKYASKCEPNDCGDVIKEAIQKSKRQNSSTWKQLFAVSMAILGQRLVSAPEAAYRLCHLPFKMCSRKAVFVNSCRPEQRFRLLRFSEDETSIFNNIFDRYQLRPDDLEGLSLAEFAVRYETVSNVNINEDDGDIELRDEDCEVPRYIRLRDNTPMRIRIKPAVLRHRYYTLNSDREGFYYNFIVLHIPFRNENDLLQEGESAEACFLRRQAELRPLLPDVSIEQFAHAEQVIQQALAQAVAVNAINNDRNDVEPSNIYADDQPMDVDNNEVVNEVNETTVMPDDVFLNGIQSLNIQQKDLLKKVSDTIQSDIRNDNDLRQLLLFITGGAGSGKSFLLKLIVEHIKRCYAPTVDVLLKPAFVEVASLTGVAARQISGKTLHSAFSLPIEKGNPMIYRKMSGQRLEMERRKWRHIKWLVIDEISMVSYENLRIIHLRLQEFKNNNNLFGGVNLLLFGDIMQLPPVKGHWCFMQPPWASAEINLWHQFSFCELSINMRQANDTEFVDLLNNLRFGELTLAQLEILCERRRIPLIGEFADGEAVRIFPTIKLVDDYNQRMTECTSQLSRIYVLNAMDESREASTYGKQPPKNVIPVDINNCGGLLHTINLAVGSRVMLRRNILVSEGLVNGAMGIVKGFQWPALRRDQLEAGELPESVLVQFDDNTIGNRIKDSDGYIRITPVSTTFQANKGYGDVERRMVPLILSWAVTVHKLQGTTLNRAVIDLGRKNFAKGQVYVALSRVKTLDGIALSDLEPNRLLKNPHDTRALTEMQRLRNI